MVITRRWVLKLKPIDNDVVYNNYNNWVIDLKYRYKARWVVQGFHQRLGIDFFDYIAWNKAPDFGINSLRIR